VILQINFYLDVPAVQYQKIVDSVAQAFLHVPGLKWKIWLLNPAAQKAGGIYLFDCQASLDAYLNGPLVAKLRGLAAVPNLSIQQFDVMPEATALTRGPVEAAATSHG
jgi:hypothetical protein